MSGAWVEKPTPDGFVPPPPGIFGQVQHAGLDEDPNWVPVRRADLTTARASLSRVRAALAAARDRADKSRNRTVILAVREVCRAVDDALGEET